ncbi:hypothetical protein BDY19DRAFT_910536 [Irpex rosettiformis]|uniref:Uncharacterized protein n=1 Tax=Irpex rosettiformis TaxID=378272 RepID=A0ACB8TNH5_9APHY|nr:hypothetical protein BDY19DRAFT_910536 [Irpex rosettiformis]
MNHRQTNVHEARRGEARYHLTEGKRIEKVKRYTRRDTGPATAKDVLERNLTVVYTEAYVEQVIQRIHYWRVNLTRSSMKTLHGNRFEEMDWMELAKSISRSEEFMRVPAYPPRVRTSAVRERQPNSQGVLFYESTLRLLIHWKGEHQYIIVVTLDALTRSRQLPLHVKHGPPDTRHHCDGGYGPIQVDIGIEVGCLRRLQHTDVNGTDVIDKPSSTPAIQSRLRPRESV